QGIDLHFANNGWEALLTLDYCSADLVLLDIMMPGMDGPTFMKILRRNKATLPVAVLTSLEPDEAKKRLPGLGAAEVLNKREIFGHLQEVIDRNLPSPMQ